MIGRPDLAIPHDRQLPTRTMPHRGTALCRESSSVAVVPFCSPLSRSPRESSRSPPAAARRTRPRAHSRSHSHPPASTSPPEAAARSPRPSRGAVPSPGAVTLTASGNPTGVTVTFSPDVIPGAATTATVEISVGAAVTTGDKTITINAAGTGVTTATATLTVVVVPATNGGITLGADPGALTANVGGAAVTSVITVTRTAPFTGPVALTVTGVPAGVTATVNPTSVTAATSTLSVQATAGAVNGLYPLVIHGAGTGVANATATVNVTVAGGAAQGASFSFNPDLGADHRRWRERHLGRDRDPEWRLYRLAQSRDHRTTDGNDGHRRAQPEPQRGDIDHHGAGNGRGGRRDVQPHAHRYRHRHPERNRHPARRGLGSRRWRKLQRHLLRRRCALWVASAEWQRRLDASESGPAASTYQFSFASGRGGIAFVVTETTPTASTDLNIVYATAAEFSALGGTANRDGLRRQGRERNRGQRRCDRGGVHQPRILHCQCVAGAGGVPCFVLNNVADGPQDLFASRADPRRPWRTRSSSGGRKTSRVVEALRYWTSMPPKHSFPARRT